MAIYAIGAFLYFCKNAKGDEVFSLGTLFALDNAGNYTENISYKVTAIGKYTTEITVTLDEGYIENASFPIVIDPTVMITGQTNTYDTFVSSANPNTNYYMNTYVRTGCDAPFGKRHTYMRFVLPSSLNGKTVTTARLNIRVQSGIAPTRVQLRAVEESWTTNTLTWSNEPDGNAVAHSLTLYQNNWYRAILTDVVQDWIDGTESNYGFILKDPAEGINYSGGVTTDWTTFYSSDAASPNKPELVVEYSSTATPEPEPEPEPEPSYNMKYINYYDSSFAGNTALINNISVAVSFSNIVYSGVCNITFEMDGNPTLYTNFVSDQCPLSSGTSCSDSSCGSVCRTHHKNLVNISNQFYNMGIANDERYVIWTNRPNYTYCEDTIYGFHVTIPAIAAVYMNRPVIHFMNIEGTSNVQKACMALNLVHETAHTFTMPDVYGSSHDLDGGYICIMELFEPEYAYDFYQNILMGFKQPFCSGCSSNIKNRALASIAN